MKGWKRIALWTLRLLIGGAFVVSGFAKLVDLWGFVFKLEEYLAVWGMTQPRTIVAVGALLLSGYEFVLGLLLAMGCYKRSASIGLTLLMLVMLPLTAWLWVANPISDCGCFGDLIVLSNGATFLKNIILTAGLITLVVCNFRLKEAMFNPAIQWIVGAWISLYAIIIGLYGYHVQPMIDFRPFPVGTSLLPDSDGDSDDNYRFVYERDGQRQEFDINNLPDSTWTFVDRTELPGRNAGGEHLAIFEGDSDVSDEVISSEGKEILLVIPEPIRADISYSYTINEISEYADSLGVSMIGLLSADEQGIERWRDVSMAEYPCYTVDDTQLKELARGTMAIVMLNDGVITSKTTISSINLPEVESPSSPERFFDELSGNVNSHFKWLNIVFGVGLLLLYLCQGIIIAIRLQFKQKRAAKRAKNATEPQPDATQTAE